MKKSEKKVNKLMFGFKIDALTTVNIQQNVGNGRSLVKIYEGVL